MQLLLCQPNSELPVRLTVPGGAKGVGKQRRWLTWPKEKSRVMLVSMPCFCSASQARMPSHVDAICRKPEDQSR